MVTKPIHPLHYHIVSPLFAILFYLFLLYCLFLVCRSSIRERTAEELSRAQLIEDLEQQQVGYPGHCP
jgi:hypothetical protein